ncbi:hypothetical protein [Lysinibacillus boronitolerans]|nr:hypothetical protein [Lysinibacillus boronitolerans]
MIENVPTESIPVARMYGQTQVWVKEHVFLINMCLLTAIIKNI